MSVNVIEISNTLEERLEEAGLTNIIEIDLDDHPVPNSICLSSIYSNDRGEGHGSAGLAILIGMANEFDFNIHLVVAGSEDDDEDSYDDHGPGFWILRWWYEKHGFEYIGNETMVYKGE